MSEFKQPDLPALGVVKDLSEEDRKQLSAFGKWVDADPGTIIIQEGDVQSSLFLVVSGMLHVETSTTGRAIFLGKLKAGDAIGEINIFDPGTASATVIAKEYSYLWSISRDTLMTFLTSHPDATAKLVIAIATQLSRRLRTTNEKVAIAQEAMTGSWGSR
ncbi:MAG: CRP/FNR family cyclic AMP-dependent transcriptional regulator [Verrucomicrobiales bacterium]|jgi:CRP/FNR family cyclic AMP-dependent transcriptional regulator